VSAPATPVRAAAGPLVRVEDAVLGPDAQVRLVVSGVSDPGRLRAAWASSGVAVEGPELGRAASRLRATSTVEALARAAGRALPPGEAAVLDAGLRAAVRAWAGSSPALLTPGGPLACDLRPLIMGIVNVTPDSFSDGGLLYPDRHPAAALAHGRRLEAEGADLLDVGGESTRPGSDPVEAAEELRRVVPVVEGLAGGTALVSVDTVKPAVARAALDGGAVVVNDVSGARSPELLEVVAASGAAYVLMHTRGTPKDMAGHAYYDDVVAEVYEYLAEGLRRCVAAGIDERAVAVDPGLGFAKTPEHNLALLRALRQFRGLGRPVLVGASRKSFLGRLLGDAPADDRLEGSLAAATAALLAGAAFLRVHDVAATVRVARVTRAVATGALDWPPPADPRPLDA
jgi:dihydropteroate synthase